MGIGHSKKWHKYNRVEKDFASLVVAEVKLEVRQSTAEKGGEGVFAGEFIPKGTILCETDMMDTSETSIVRKMNDLLYAGKASEYKNREKTANPTNVINVHADVDPISYVISGKAKGFIETSRDLEAGEELSRYYGANYWYGHEFREKYGELLKRGEYPSVYTFIGEYRQKLEFNLHKKVFCKYVDGKYYYVEGRMLSNNYYHKIEKFKSLPLFASSEQSCEYFDSAFGKYEERSEEQKKAAWNLKYLVNLTKEDFSKYEADEPLVFKFSDKYFSSEYLLKQKEAGL